MIEQMTRLNHKIGLNHELPECRQTKGTRNEMSHATKLNDPVMDTATTRYSELDNGGHIKEDKVVE